MKKMWSLLLAALLLCSVTMVGVSAETGGSDGDNYTDELFGQDISETLAAYFNYSLVFAEQLQEIVSQLPDAVTSEDQLALLAQMDQFYEQNLPPMQQAFEQLTDSDFEALAILYEQTTGERLTAEQIKVSEQEALEYNIYFWESIIRPILQMAENDQEQLLQDLGNSDRIDVLLDTCAQDLNEDYLNSLPEVDDTQLFEYQLEYYVDFENITATQYAALAEIRYLNSKLSDDIISYFNTLCDYDQFIADVQAYAAAYEETVERGDINGDGYVNNKDFSRLKAYLADDETLIVQSATELTGDDWINNKDLSRLKAHLADNDVAFG